MKTLAKLGTALGGFATLIWVFFSLVSPLLNRNSEPPVPQPLPERVQPKIEDATRNHAYGQRNDHCEDPRDVAWKVKATEGWKLDIHKIDVKVASISKKSTYFGVKDKSENGFTIAGLVANSGTCFLFAKDGRAHSMCM